MRVLLVGNILVSDSPEPGLHRRACSGDTEACMGDVLEEPPVPSLVLLSLPDSWAVEVLHTDILKCAFSCLSTASLLLRYAKQEGTTFYQVTHSQRWGTV